MLQNYISHSFVNVTRINKLSFVEIKQKNLTNVEKSTASSNVVNAHKTFSDYDKFTRAFAMYKQKKSGEKIKCTKTEFLHDKVKKYVTGINTKFSFVKKNYAMFKNQR